MWILRNLWGGSYREGGRQTIRLLNTENKLRVDAGWGEGESDSNTIAMDRSSK